MYQYHIQVVVARLVVTEARFGTELLTDLGSLALMLVRFRYDHFNYDRLD